jgi:hypothetical protein
MKTNLSVEYFLFTYPWLFMIALLKKFKMARKSHQLNVRTNSAVCICFEFESLHIQMISLFFNAAESMDTDAKKPFMKPSTMAPKKTQEEQQMTCERLLTGEDTVRIKLPTNPTGPVRIISY